MAYIAMSYLVMACVGTMDGVMLGVGVGSRVGAFDGVTVPEEGTCRPYSGHNYIGHNYRGHSYIVHHYTDHN